MKTWTNPSVEELEVKLTAEGGIPSYWEQIFDEDLPVINDSLKPKTQS